MGSIIYIGQLINSILMTIFLFRMINQKVLSKEFQHAQMSLLLIFYDIIFIFKVIDGSVIGKENFVVKEHEHFIT